MTLLWMESLATGVEIIDSQHKRFLELINELKRTFAQRENEAITEENRLEVYRSLLRLRDYAFFHFGTEERFMLGAKYPEFIQHKSRHDDFIKALFDMEQQVLAGTLVPGAIIEYAMDWYREHIGKVDQQMGNFLKAVKAEPGKLG